MLRLSASLFLLLFISSIHITSSTSYVVVVEDTNHLNTTRPEPHQEFKNVAVNGQINPPVKEDKNATNTNHHDRPNSSNHTIVKSKNVAVNGQINPPVKEDKNTTNVNDHTNRDGKTCRRVCAIFSLAVLIFWLRTGKLAKSIVPLALCHLHCAIRTVLLALCY